MDDLKWTVERQINMLNYVRSTLDDMRRDFNDNTYNEALDSLDESIELLREVIED